MGSDIYSTRLGGSLKFKGEKKLAFFSFYRIRLAHLFLCRKSKSSLSKSLGDPERLREKATSHQQESPSETPVQGGASREASADASDQGRRERSGSLPGPSASASSGKTAAELRFEEVQRKRVSTSSHRIYDAEADQIALAAGGESAKGGQEDPQGSGR
jgi:hypothetical protein